MLKRKLLILISVLGLWSAFPGAALAQPLHSVMLTVPGHPEEALNWCGPATGQMIMEAYPSGACSVLQEDVWLAAQSHKTEALWDTDPVGLKEAMKALCPPVGTWSVHSRTDAAELMHSVAYWMTRNNYPAAVVLNTLPHNDYTEHGEHWVTVRGIITDADPTTTGTVNLEFVWFNDPAVPLGEPALERFVAGSTWYGEFQPVNKPGSTYQGKYVAVIEPPQFAGRLVARIPARLGPVIPPDEAVKAAARWIKEYRLTEIGPYQSLADSQPRTPILVNKEYGGYYLIPFAGKEAKTASVALLVNAYDGSFEEVGAFAPTRFLAMDEAITLAKDYLKAANPKDVTAEAVYPQGDRRVGKYHPLWKVRVDGKTLGVGNNGKIFSRMPNEKPFIPLPGLSAAGMAWDGQAFWTVDARSRQLLKLDPVSGAVLGTLGIEQEEPSAVAFGAETLWVADVKKMQIQALDPESGRVRNTIPLKIPEDKGFQSLEGMAWDGKFLWTTFFAGFSSSINRIDPNSGEILQSVFADCHPRGIASDGTYLYLTCYNGDRLPAKIDRRKIADTEVDMLKSRSFVSDLDIKDPGGMAFDGQFLWVTDRLTRKAQRILPISAAAKP